MTSSRPRGSASTFETRPTVVAGLEELVGVTGGAPAAVEFGVKKYNTACRRDHLTVHLRATGLGAIADLGFIGLDDNDDPDSGPAVITGYKAARNRPLPPGQKLSNTVLAAVRAPVEHGFAHLKNWRVLTKLRTDPKSATALVRALLVLTNREIAR